MPEYNDKYYIGDVLTEKNLNDIWQYVLELLESNGGENSGLNADLLDGHHASYFIARDELDTSVMQPNFYIGGSSLDNMREENKQFLTTDDLLLKNIHGYSNLNILNLFFSKTSATEYANYYHDLVRKLLDYKTTSGNIENDKNINIIDENTHLPEKSNNPDTRHELDEVVNDILSNIERWNNDSGGFNFTKNIPLTTLLNRIITMVILNFLDSKNHDDRITDIEKFFNQYLNTDIRNMISDIRDKHYKTANYMDMDSSYESIGVGEKLNSDTVNGIQIVPITQEDYNKLSPDLKNSWNVLYRIVENKSYMPKDGEYEKAIYDLPSRKFNLQFSLEDNIIRDTYGNINGGTLDLMYSLNNSTNAKKLITVFDFSDTLSNNSLIQTEYLKQLLSDIFTNLEDEGINIDDLKKFIEDSKDFSSIYEKSSNKRSIINESSVTDEVGYPSTKAVYEYVSNFVNILDNQIVSEYGTMEVALSDLNKKIDNISNAYITKDFYQKDMELLKQYLDKLVGV